MSAVEIDVKYVAHLARLSLSSEEEQTISEQLGHILGYIEKLKEVDVSGVEPTAHAFPLINVTRPDEVRPSLSQEEALRNAPAQANGLFVAPKLFEWAGPRAAARQAPKRSTIGPDWALEVRLAPQPPRYP